ncbi:MAG: hypothetical protein GAK31_01739 [Stenotrophomonas maltophilia]|uniref:Phosphate-selective porin O and P n=1 Tax=Stenotrophomonas maltophilia TaxID=40324 RepID=A0A7V8FI36_STEMA|nr:MAG: hypothetical protein GAK31_01739 [Stenotrophomonas maltophilia]
MRALPFLFAAALQAAAAESLAESTGVDAAPRLDVGGAVRFNYGWLDYGPTSRLQLELLRADLSGAAGALEFSAQYRWYDGFDAVHHAWAGWNMGEDTQLRAGIQQVPFGLLPTASQSFWFGSGYYLGIEDDYDPGLVLQHRNGNRLWHAGVFFGDEYGSGARYDRYSFDVAQTAALPYRERGRVHLRHASSVDWAGGELQLGASAFTGRVQNTRSRRQHGRHGAAVHAQWQSSGWTAQLQWARYRYAIAEPRIAMAAFLAPFEIAAEADVPSANLARRFEGPAWLDSITCYNNLSMTRPVRRGAGLRPSWQNVSGCSLHKGMAGNTTLITYVDWIAGRNMWFAGGDGIGINDGGPSRWRSRLNLNIGLYF